MLKRRFDPFKLLQVILYLRVSSDEQNPRSPQQQRDTIEATIKRLGYPWCVVAVYADEAISGRYLRKRAGFQRMLRDIRTGKVKADAILVDTFERFGRADELAALRQELYQHQGVLVLTADTQFTDPTSTSGKALAAFESLRSTEDNRVKAHNVLRGKRDAARLGHWPGGPPPFGYKLHSVMVERHGRQEVDHCLLVPDPDTSWIIQKLFRLAREKGLGCTRLARLLNQDPDVPERHKPFYDQTVNYWLRQEIYYGELVWEEHSTEVVADRRVIERNPEDQFVRVPNFCKPLVPREDWDVVQELRRARSERARLARQAKQDNGGKQIAAVTPGLSLSYLLSGLVCCGHCNRSMTVSSSSAYTTRSGEMKRYASYVCPGHVAGVCPNGTRVPENWLRATVVDLIRRRLLPADEWTVAALLKTDWFAPLLEQIQRELDRLSEERHDARPALERERSQLGAQIQGWLLSLAKPDLSPTVRSVIERDMEGALQRQQEVERQLSEADALQAQAAVDPEQVVGRLKRLAEVLAAESPSRTNLELSLHIGSIRCHRDGQVLVRTCKLGALAGGLELFAGPADAPLPAAPDAEGVRKARPRRRAVRRVEDGEGSQAELQAAAHLAADVQRFEGLGPEWFWEDRFRMPGRTCWSDEHAEEVSRLRRETWWPLSKLAEHLGKSIPTIRRALKRAGIMNPDQTDGASGA